MSIFFFIYRFKIVLIYIYIYIYIYICICFKDKYERNNVIRNVSKLKEAEEPYKKFYIAKNMKPEEKKEYQQQVEKAKELWEREENKGKLYVV